MVLAIVKLYSMISLFLFICSVPMCWCRWGVSCANSEAISSHLQTHCHVGLINLYLITTARYRCTPIEPIEGARDRPYWNGGCFSAPLYHRVIHQRCWVSQTNTSTSHLTCANGDHLASPPSPSYRGVVAQEDVILLRMEKTDYSDYDSLDKCKRFASWIFSWKLLYKWSALAYNFFILKDGFLI